jgi:hypothetical protein
MELTPSQAHAGSDNQWRDGAGELFLDHAPLNQRCYIPAPATTRPWQFEVASKPERDDMLASQIFCAAAVNASAKGATGHRATCSSEGEERSTSSIIDVCSCIDDRTGYLTCGWRPASAVGPLSAEFVTVTGFLRLSMVLPVPPTSPSGGNPISLMGTTIPHPDQQMHTARPSF